MSRALLFATVVVGLVGCAKKWTDLAPFPCTEDGKCPSGFRCTPATQICCAPLAEDDLCNGIDDDCDGVVDNGFADAECSAEQAGSVCVDGRCQCPLMCGGSCVDPDTNNAHCGGCNQPCGSARTCVDGECACRSDSTMCGGECVDVRSANQHCGRCNQACPTNATCSDGDCVCKGLNQAMLCDGVCVDTWSSVEHCGGCNQACDTSSSGVFPVRSTSCYQGQCKNVEELTTVNATTSLAVSRDDTFAYLVDYSGVSVRALPLSGGPAVQRLAATGTPVDAAGASVNDSSVYFYDRVGLGDGFYVIKSVLRTGTGAASAITNLFIDQPDKRPRRMIQVGGAIYTLTAADEIWRSGISVGGASFLGTGSITSDQNAAYIINADGVFYDSQGDLFPIYQGSLVPTAAAQAIGGTVYLGYPNEVGFVGGSLIGYEKLQSLPGTPTALSAPGFLPIFVLTATELLRFDGSSPVGSVTTTMGGRDLQSTENYVYWIENDTALLRVRR